MELNYLKIFYSDIGEIEFKAQLRQRECKAPTIQ
jgi:hypothetical protein